MEEIKKVQEAATLLREILPQTPKIVIVLGSGLANAVKLLKSPMVMATKEIPHFPTQSVEGHQGKVIFGTVHNTPTLIYQGRVHSYEGYSPNEVIFPIRVAKELGVESVLLTNAAGALSTELSPLDLVILEDQINFTGKNPLSGPNIDYFGPRFPDMTEIYSIELREILEKSFRDANIKPHKGIYCGVSGPSFETPAEVRMLASFGGKVVGMSTVFESIAARHMGLKVAGISYISNLAAGLSSAEISHEEVQEAGKMASEKVISILQHFFQYYGPLSSS